MQSVLRNRTFRGLFAGRVVTNVGDSLYFVAAMWLVWELTGNEFYSGLAGFLTLAPTGLQFLFGPLVDRWDLRRVLVGTQLAQAVLVLAVPVAHLTGTLSVWVVLAVMPTLSLLNQVVYPAESAALPRIVEQDELVAANSLFSLSYQGVDAVFNAVAGIVVAVLGAVAVFALDAVTFLLAAAIFTTIRVPRATQGDDPETDARPVGTRPSEPPASSDGAAAVGVVETDGGNARDAAEVSTDAGAIGRDDGAPVGALRAYGADLREGFAFLRGTFLVLLVGGSVVVNFALGATIAVLPSYGALVGGAQGYGFLMAALGAGVLVGAVGASALSDRPLGYLSVAAFASAGVAWTTAVVVGWFPLTVALFLAAFVPVGVTNVMLASALQAVVPETILGRVTAVLGSASSFATPFGALAGGVLAATVGPTPVLLAAGGGFLFLAAYVFAIPALRGLPAVGDIDTLAVDDAA